MYMGKQYSIIKALGTFFRCYLLQLDASMENIETVDSRYEFTSSTVECLLSTK